MEKNSSIILKHKLTLQGIINQLEFVESDIRSYYFYILKSIFSHFYNGYFFLELNAKILKNKAILEILKLNSGELNSIKRPFISEQNMNAYISNYNSDFLISSWSIFELLITTLCENILSQDTKSKLLSHAFTDIEEHLSLPSESELVKSKLTKKHLAHVPMNRKYSKLFKKIKKDYARIIKEDQNFLEFFGKFRNTIHSNYIYFGDKTYTYDFEGIEFVFIKNQVVRYNDPQEFSPNLYLKIVSRLTNISFEICKNIKFEGIIPYPDLEAENGIFL